MSAVIGEREMGSGGVTSAPEEESDRTGASAGGACVPATRATVQPILGGEGGWASEANRGLDKLASLGVF